ncbi:hypothetical protein GCM10010094_88610 [Streptomyces flaveus]|uniref:Uncharacterized protein n=1 Tax=Streptomyces flaveus TaxID=66370 RepID=A0A917RMI9_9ACTN|nr:hypothetical protein GCM10010094_88610 [Streptomyces flaveus]
MQGPSAAGRAVVLGPAAVAEPAGSRPFPAEVLTTSVSSVTEARATPRLRGRIRRLVGCMQGAFRSRQPAVSGCTLSDHPVSPAEGARAGGDRSWEAVRRGAVGDVTRVTERKGKGGK